MAQVLHLTEGMTFAGDFRIVRPLAEGGMGALYLVDQLSTGSQRALKLMHPQLVSDTRLRERFALEARVGSRIDSDHVVHVVGAGIDATLGVPWLAMELLRGDDLTTTVTKRGRLTPAELLEVFGQLSHALSSAHDQGIVHRDLKPENIFLAVPRREGVSFTVKILDFGIAKLVAEAKTKHTAAIGSPLWMAPEQTDTSREISVATDIWPLGLIAFYALTGQYYWRGATESSSVVALIREIVFEPLPGATLRATELGVRDRLPAHGFDEWFMRCVAREPSQRFASVRDARQALIATLAEPTPYALQQGAAGVPPLMVNTLPALEATRGWHPPTVSTPPHEYRPQAGQTEVSQPGLGRSSTAPGAVIPTYVPGTPRPSRRSAVIAGLVGGGAIAAGSVGIFAWRAASGAAPAPSVAPSIGSGVSASAGDLPPIKVGILHSLSGTMGVTEATLKDVALMAIQQLNAAGGLLGRKLEPVVVDPASNWPLFAEKARSLLSEERVVVLFGCFTSVSRKSVLPVLEELNGLLFYPAQYEGEESSSNIFYTGAVPNQTAIPGVEYLMSKYAGSAERLVLLGTDFVYPRVTNKILRYFLHGKNVSDDDIKEMYTPFGFSDYESIVANIKKFAAGKRTAVLSTINGESNAAFYGELLRQGLSAIDVPVLALSIGEQELRDMDRKPLVGQLAVWSYVMSIDSPQNKQFVADWRQYAAANELTVLGKPVTTDAMEATYIGINMWAHAVQRAGTIDVNAVRDAMGHQELDAPCGFKLRMDATNHHLHRPAFISEIGEDGQFKVVWKTDGPIKAEPWSHYLPENRSKLP